MTFFRNPYGTRVAVLSEISLNICLARRALPDGQDNVPLFELLADGHTIEGCDTDWA